MEIDFVLTDFHEASLSKHMDIDECLSDDSDLSFDHISLQEKSLSVRSSQSQLTSMDEVGLLQFNPL